MTPCQRRANHAKAVTAALLGDGVVGENIIAAIEDAIERDAMDDEAEFCVPLLDEHIEEDDEVTPEEEPPVPKHKG